MKWTVFWLRNGIVNNFKFNFFFDFNCTEYFCLRFKWFLVYLRRVDSWEILQNQRHAVFVCFCLQLFGLRRRHLRQNTKQTVSYRTATWNFAFFEFFYNLLEIFPQSRIINEIVKKTWILYHCFGISFSKRTTYIYIFVKVETFFFNSAIWNNLDLFLSNELFFVIWL